MSINPELFKTIKSILESNPNYSEDKVLDVIINGNNSLRMNQQAIKYGVGKYFKTMKEKSEAKPEPKVEINGNQNHIIQIEDEGKPKKKVKKNDFAIEFEDSADYNFQKLGGITQLYAVISHQIFTPIYQSSLIKSITSSTLNKGFLITGAVGCGKTLLANCTLSYLKNHKSQNKQISTFAVSGYELLGNDAQQKIKKIFDTAVEREPSIIFIDNIDEICNKDNNKRMQASPVIALCSQIERIRNKQIYVLSASASFQKLDSLIKPGLFYKTIKINNPDQNQRKDMLHKILVKFQNSLTSNEIQELAKMTAGFVAVDLVSFAQQATMKCVQRINLLKEQEKTQAKLNFQDFKNGFKQVQPVLKKEGFAKIPTTKLEDVGALTKIKEQLTQQIIMPMRDQQKFKNMNFQVSSGGILLYGPPGCGKTMIAKAIANEANANFITVKGPQLLTKYVGESQEAVRKVFQRARMSAPCIIFFDEFDALASKRQDQGNQVTERVVNTLLNELNGVDDRRMVFVIAATNRPDIIDEAVLRSGRIEKHLYVPLPNKSERLQILQKIVNKISREEQLGLQDISQRTDNFSGADLHFLVKKAIINAISSDRNKVSSEDIRIALQNYKSDKYDKKNLFKMSQQTEPENDNDLPIDIPTIKDSSIMEKQQNETVHKKNPTISDNIINEFFQFLMKKMKK